MKEIAYRSTPSQEEGNDDDNSDFSDSSGSDGPPHQDNGDQKDSFQEEDNNQDQGEGSNNSKAPNTNSSKRKRNCDHSNRDQCKKRRSGDFYGNHYSCELVGGHKSPEIKVLKVLSRRKNKEKKEGPKLCQTCCSSEDLRVHSPRDCLRRLSYN